jgi:hypothetical protein
VDFGIHKGGTMPVDIKDTTATNKTLEFINKAKKVHNDKYDYSLVEYVNARTKVKIIDAHHGVFEQTPTDHLNGKGCPRSMGVRNKDK